MTTPLDAALKLARRGFAVLPVRGKHPTGYSGVSDAGRDPDRIRELWTQRTAATDFLAPDGIAVAGGHALPRGGYLGILDRDDYHGGAGSLAELTDAYGDLPATWTVVTPRGGRHYYLATLEPIRPRIAFRPGLDWRGQGSYAVAWGPGYTPSPRSIGACPAWLLAVLNPPARVSNVFDNPPTTAPRYIAAAIASECVEMAGAPEGTRNARLNRAAFSLARFVAQGQADAAELVQLLAYAASRAGLPEREIARTIQSGFKARGVML